MIPHPDLLKYNPEQQKNVKLPMDMTFKHDGPDDGGDNYSGFLGNVGKAMRCVKKIKEFIDLIHADDSLISSGYAVGAPLAGADLNAVLDR